MTRENVPMAADSEANLDPGGSVRNGLAGLQVGGYVGRANSKRATKNTEAVHRISTSISLAIKSGHFT